jgi:hypothetical protein
MLTRSLAGIALGLAVMLMTGCAMVQKGETVVKFDRGELPIMGQATTDGQYSLYKQADATPMVTYTLKAGDKLGFERNTDGKLFAVAGQHRQEVMDDSFYWRRRY